MIINDSSSQRVLKCKGLENIDMVLLCCNPFFIIFQFVKSDNLNVIDSI